MAPSLDVANVIWATGYRPDYGFVAADVVGEDGWPVEERGVSPRVPGLYFLGVPFQYAFTSMLVTGAGRDAKYVVERLAERVRGRDPAACPRLPRPDRRRRLVQPPVAYS